MSAPVPERHYFDESSKLVCSIQFLPFSLDAQGQFENNGQRRLSAEAALGLHGSQAHRGERALDRVGGADVLPMLGKKILDTQQALTILDDALDRIMTAISGRNPRVETHRIAGVGNNGTLIKVSDDRTQMKIETSPVTRRAVYPTTLIVPSHTVTEKIGFREMKVLTFVYLYGGKFHTALDRQHELCPKVGDGDFRRRVL